MSLQKNTIKIYWQWYSKNNLKLHRRCQTFFLEMYVNLILQELLLILDMQIKIITLEYNIKRLAECIFEIFL